MGLSPQRFGVAPRLAIPRLKRPSHTETYHDPLGVGSENPLEEMSDSARSIHDPK